jgi:hypothetical protein
MLLWTLWADYRLWLAAISAAELTVKAIPR